MTLLLRRHFGDTISILYCKVFEQVSNTEFSQEDDRFVKVHTNSSGFPERWILFIIDQMKKYVEEMQLEPEPEPPPFGVRGFAAFDVASIPETHNVTAWRNYHGPYCKWMRDTGVMAPDNCLSHFVECENQECPISQPLNNGTKPAWKTRFCNPTNCRFFEW